MIDGIRRFIRERDLLASGSRVVAAVSGGSDSVALLHILLALDRERVLTLAGVAHFNHQLRPAADDDERFVADMARTLERPFVSDREDVAVRAARDGQSIENAARSARHQFFERARLGLEADVVALGHTRDDQAETFLLRLLRGAGPRGLAAMFPRNGRIVRPLLGTRRHELRAWLEGRGIGFVDDATNADVAIPRNRVRAELLPLLAGRFNPNIVNVLADEAELLRELWGWLEAESDAYLASVDLEVGLDIHELALMPPPLRRTVVWRAMSAAAGGRTIDVDHVDAALRLIHTDAADGGPIDVPGHRVQRIEGRIVLKNAVQPRPPAGRSS